MPITLEQRRNLHTTGYILVIAVFVAVFYTAFSDGFDSFYPYVNALIISVGITGIVAMYEFVVFNRQVRKRGFRVLLLLRILLYSISIVFVILGVLIFTRMLKNDMYFMEVLRSEEFMTYVQYGDFKILIPYVIGVVVLVNFTLQMNRKMGQGVLLGLVLGHYRKPRQVDRFLMFVKIPGARKLAEQMGNEKYLQFVNELLFDITDRILYRRGFIAEYVDSEMLITWEVEHGKSQSNCLRMFFDICHVLAREKINYFEKYGAVASFIGALHKGSVVLGEVGEIKSEIVYTGDAINTTHRLLREAKAAGQLVVSKEAIEALEVPSIYQVSDLGDMPLRGRQHAVPLKMLTEL